MREAFADKLRAYLEENEAADIGTPYESYTARQRRRLQALLNGEPVIAPGSEVACVVTIPGMLLALVHQVRIEPDGSLTEVRSVKDATNTVVDWVPVRVLLEAG